MGFLKKLESHFFKNEIIYDQVEPSYVKIFQGVEDSLETISIRLNNILLKVKKLFLNLLLPVLYYMIYKF